MSRAVLTSLVLALVVPMANTASAETLGEVANRVEDRAHIVGTSVAIDVMRGHGCVYDFSSPSKENQFEAEALLAFAKALEVETPLESDVEGYLDQIMDGVFEDLMETGALSVDTEVKVATLVEGCA